LHVSPGGSNSTSYGLINDKNETVTVKLRVEGTAAPFITIPEQIELLPDKFTPVYVNVSVPSDYDYSKGTNITGYVYALLAGTPGGQVTINVQTRKTVEVLIPEKESSAQLTSQSLPFFPSLPISGFATLFENPYGVFGFSLLFFLALFGTIALIIKRKRR